MNKMEGFVTFEKFTSFKRETNGKFTNIDKRIEPLAKSTELKAQIDELKDFCLENYKKYSLRKDCMKDRTEI